VEIFTAQVRIRSNSTDVAAGRINCPKCGKMILRRNLSKHRSRALCRRFAILAPHTSRMMGRDATSALKGRVIGRHPSLGAPAAPLELFMEATRQATNYTLALDGKERVFFSCCQTCFETKKGLRYCRSVKKHTTDDYSSTSMAQRKSSPFLGVGWSSQKVWLRLTILPDDTIKNLSHINLMQFHSVEQDLVRVIDLRQEMWNLEVLYFM
jgi:hypothetical protein